MAQEQGYDGFLETALGRAGRAEAEDRSPLDPAPSIAYTEEVDTGRTFAIGPQIETILGYTPEQWMGDADLWIDRIHPQDRDRVVAACDQANEARETYRADYRIVASSGAIVWVHDEAELIGGSEGQPLCWQGLMTVVTPS
jgi:PAS domain S-box-containing protein